MQERRSLSVLRRDDRQGGCYFSVEGFIGSRSIQLEQVPTSAARCVQLELLHRAAMSARRMPHTFLAGRVKLPFYGWGARCRLQRGRR
jgi:hypothetical protein